VSSSEEQPHWNTASLWGILAVFLVVGTAGAATVVYGLVGIAAGNLLDGIAIAVGAVIAALAFLFMAGILYRVDRYRGTKHRRIDLFE
jgi:amino acid transporter